MFVAIIRDACRMLEGQRCIVNADVDVCKPLHAFVFVVQVWWDDYQIPACVVQGGFVIKPKVPLSTRAVNKLPIVVGVILHVVGA